MNTKTLWPTALALAISACLLGGCGGGGSNGMVRTESLPPSPPPSPPPPPPSSAPTEPCPAPVTADCVVEPPSTDDYNQTMTGGRQSNYALLVHGGAYLSLFSEPNTYGPPVVDYRFDNGTTIEDGTLLVNSSASLHSDVVVQSAGNLYLSGELTGTVINHGDMSLASTVFGDVTNDGVLTPGYAHGGDVLVRIKGNFTQTAAGTLDALVPTDASFGTVTGGFLSVTGRADIDGTLRLFQGADWDAGSFPLPGAPLSLKVLHADGGVFGQFAQWTSPGLLITGSVRYLANDVFFDASSISAAQAMAAARAGDAVTLSAARDFDAALGGSAGLAQSPGSSLTDPQRRFLESAAMIQRLQNYEQAVRTFDSLSGYGYLAAADALLQQATIPAQGLIARVSNLQPGSAAGTWAAQPTTLATGAGTFSEQRSGFDQWLGDGLLVGGSVGWSDGNLKFDRSGGNARDRSPQWDFYVRRTGANDSYVLGNVGYSQHDLSFGRQIDLGLAKRNAYAMRDLDVEHAWVESGREFRILQSRVTPFAALSYAAMHGTGFTERGNTGFELAAQPSFHQRINAAAGLRFSRYWGSGKGRWTQLNLSGGFLHLLSARDDAYAAFIGAPDVTFALAGPPRQRNTGWLQMSLGTGGETWAWLLNYDRQAEAEAASVGMQLKF